MDTSRRPKTLSPTSSRQINPGGNWTTSSDAVRCTWRRMKCLSLTRSSVARIFPDFVADRLEGVKWRNWKLVFYDQQRDWWTPPYSRKLFTLSPAPKKSIVRLHFATPGPQSCGGCGGCGCTIREIACSVSADQARRTRSIQPAELSHSITIFRLRPEPSRLTSKQKVIR